MQAVFIVIYEPDMLQDILTGLLEVGVTRATIVESQGMGRAVMDRMSIFAGFRDIWGGNIGYGYTLFTVVEDKIIDELVRAIKDILADRKVQNKGVLFTLPVGRFENLTD